MHRKIKILAFGILTLVIATQCKPKSSQDNDKAHTFILPSQEKSATTIFNTITKQFFTGNELMTHDLVGLKIIDTSLTIPLSETCYCDTTIRLNDKVSYSVISVNDKAGLCTYFFIASLNRENGKVVASKYLHSDCDIDYSLDTYELHEHKIVSNDKIELINTTIFQKKSRTSADEEENIDHKQISKNVFAISQTGQINDSR